MRRHSSGLTAAVFSLLLLFSPGCTKEAPPEISLENRKTPKAVEQTPQHAGLRIGMGAMITPKEGYIYYRQLQEYLEKRLQQHVSLVDRENYDEMNGLLENGSVDAAFVCAGPYVEGREKFGLELLAMPLVNGKPEYFAYIIVPKESPVQKLADLRGKRFAFTDPKSNSGKLVPTYMLARMGETPESFFGAFSYTYGHDKAINAVAQKLVDGASVDSLIYEYMKRKTPDLIARTRIVEKSDPYGIPPFVVRKDLPFGIKEQLRITLTSMHQNPEGKAILQGIMTDRFVAGDDTNYDSIREMNRWISGQAKAKGKK